MLPHSQPEINPWHLMTIPDHKPGGPVRAETTSIETMILKVQLQLTGHVIWMEDTGMPKQVLYEELFLRKRNQDIPQQRFNYCVKAHIAHAGFIPKQLEQYAQDYFSKHPLTKQAPNSFKEKW